MKCIRVSSKILPLKIKNVLNFHFTHAEYHSSIRIEREREREQTVARALGALDHFTWV